MTIRSPDRRLRLFILSLSLFCSGVAAAQSKQELKRYSRRAFHEIESKQTKWIWSGPAAGQNPPQQVTLEGLKKDRRSPFDERIEIKCILFTDGTGWRSPDAEAKTCDELVKVTLKYNPHPNRMRIDPGNP